MKRERRKAFDRGCWKTRSESSEWTPLKNEAWTSKVAGKWELNYAERRKERVRVANKRERKQLEGRRKRTGARLKGTVAKDFERGDNGRKGRNVDKAGQGCLGKMMSQGPRRELDPSLKDPGN